MSEESRLRRDDQASWSEGLPGGLLEPLHELEAALGGPVLLLATLALDPDHLPKLYAVLRDAGRCERLSVLVYCRGGSVIAARRIVLLLREFADRVTFLVPYCCESAGTLMALGVDEVIAGPLASFSPIDPHLRSATAPSEGAPPLIAARDIEGFREMSGKWFGVRGRRAREQMLSFLSQKIFPTTMSAFYRSTLQVEKIADEMLALQLPGVSRSARTRIATQLVHGYHSHDYSITPDEMRSLGLRVVKRPELEAPSWSVLEEVQRQLGVKHGAASETWNDSLLAGPGRAQVRSFNPSAGHRRWEEWPVA